MITIDPQYLTLNNLLGRVPIYRTTLIKGPNAIAPLGQTFHWPLNETSGSRVTTYPSSPVLSLTSNGSVVSTTGIVGNAANFNGFSQWLSLAGSALPAGDVSFGGRCWVYLTDLSFSRVVASQFGGAGHRSWIVMYEVASNNFIFSVIDAADNVRTVRVNIPVVVNTIYELRWKRIANPSGMLYMQLCTTNFVSGVYQTDVNASGAFIPNFDTTEDVRVGASRGDGSTIDGYWVGWIDELTLTRGSVLSPDEEATLYDNGLGNSLPIPASKYTTYSFDTSHDMNNWNDALANPTTAVSALLPTSLQRNLEMAYSRFPLSTLNLRVKNQIGAPALFLVNSAGVQCSFDGAFWDLPGIYVRWFTGEVTDVQVDEGDYLLMARGKLDIALQTLIFNGAKTRLSNDINANLFDWPVENSESFSNVNTNPFSYVVVDNELTFYHGIRPGLLLSIFRVTTPFVLPPLLADSEAAPHSIGAEVRELVHLGRIHANNGSGGQNNMHPVDYFAAILTGSSGLFNTVEFSGKAVLPRNLGITLDYNSLNTTYNLLGTELQMLFMMDEGVSSKDFLENEICFPLALYPFETASGSIALLPYPQESDYTPVMGANSGYDTIDDNHLLSVPRYDKAAETQINQVHYYYDYNPITREYARLDKFIDDNLLKLHGKPLPLEIHSRGLRSIYSDGTHTWFWYTDTALLAAAKRHLSRFGSRAPVLKCETILRDHIYECGDDVTLLAQNVPDEVNGTVTNIIRPTRIVGTTIDFEANLCTLDLMEHTAFQSTVRKMTS